MDKKEGKSYCFSEEIDSSINGFALGATLCSVAMIIWYIELFHNKIIEAIFTIILMVLGIGGTFLEIEKTKEIKGMIDFFMGTIITCLDMFVIIKFDNIVVNSISSLILLFSIFAVFSGILKILYSFKIKTRKTKNKKIEVFKIITGLTEAIALVVVILQLVAELVKN